MGSPPGLDDLPAGLRDRVSDVLDEFLREATRRSDAFEFATYRLSARPLPEMEPGEDSDLVRAVLRVAARRRLEEIWPGRRFEPEVTDMVVEIRPRATQPRETQPREGVAAIWFEPQPAYVAGRYRKLVRGLSQTRLDCYACRGRGTRRGEVCASCEGRGRAVPEAVEDFVRPVLQDALAGAESAFHGSGREDVDVRMLGSGRPFAVSVASPRRRSIDAAALAAEIALRSGGRVEVDDLRVVARATVKRLTSEHGVKRYRAVVRPVGDARLPDDAAQRVAALSGALLGQRTPRRVERRADLVRERRVRTLTVESAEPDALVLQIETDPGLYVKEFVSSDEGRTTPSVAAVLETPCVCAELDVLGVVAPEADGSEAAVSPDGSS